MKKLSCVLLFLVLSDPVAAEPPEQQDQTPPEQQDQTPPEQQDQQDQTPPEQREQQDQTQEEPEQPEEQEQPEQTQVEPQPFEVHGTPTESLKAAQDAFRTGDFASLRRLLEPFLYPEPLFETANERLEARQLLGLGLYYDAQQVADADTRRAYLELARRNFLELLLERPDFSLDPLLYPASVVELFESVRAAHANELNKLLAEQRGGADESGVETIYVERDVSRRTPALSYFPFGIGQFQNGEAVKGTLFAVGQGIALGLNVTSYLIVESLRGDDGYYDPGPDRRSGDYQTALTWRNVMYGSLATFIGLYAASVIDAVLNFDETDVKIRALDTPPPELMPSGQQSGSNLTVGLGWSLQFSF